MVSPRMDRSIARGMLRALVRATGPRPTASYHMSRIGGLACVTVSFPVYTQCTRLKQRGGPLPRPRGVRGRKNADSPSSKKRMQNTSPDSGKPA